MPRPCWESLRGSPSADAFEMMRPPRPSDRPLRIHRNGVGGEASFSETAHFTIERMREMLLLVRRRHHPIGLPPFVRTCRSSGVIQEPDVIAFCRAFSSKGPKSGAGGLP